MQYLPALPETILKRDNLLHTYYKNESSAGFIHK